MLWEAVSAVHDLGRLYDLTTILLRYGFAGFVRRMGLAHAFEQAGRVLHWKGVEELVQLDTPQRIRRALEEMGPTFIKLGQILATRVDLFPPDWIAEFEKLQDEVPPLPFEQIRPQLEEDLGAPVDTVFAKFETEALAAASLAQVHRARLFSGEEVIVKIRRPGVVELVEADLRLLARLARIAESEVKELRRYRPLEIMHQFTVSLRREMDFENECRNAERMARNFAGNPWIVIPKVYWEWSCERLNVQEYIDGIPGRKLQLAEAAGLNRKILARRGADAVLKMILIDGFFHADPHPGNIIFLPGNRLAFIDFGMVGRLSEARRYQIVDMLAAVIDRDARTAVNVLLDWAGDVHVDIDALLIDVDVFIDTYHGLPLKQLKIANILTDLTNLMRDYHLVLPADLALLFKALLTLDGMGRQVDPDFDLILAATPHVRRALFGRYRPDVLLKRGWRTASDVMDIVAALPYDMRRLIKAIRTGSLRFNVDLNQLDYFSWIIDRAASRLTVGMVTSSLIIGSSIVMTVPGGPTLWGLPMLGVLGFAGAGIGGVWLLISIWRGGHLRHGEEMED
ncbi:MAG: ubiquinone biosynthesis protein UbiB [Methylothermaceae bacteria B42]|nr:MAG: ubiquinone biosynthesis protein UbiB [Methylothermaceae bacteria B42]HHJ37851.1 ubiquinone biosynthesis protein UbiB [Methylothermaceae bacterium]